MNQPTVSDHFKTRKPSAIRLAQIEYSKREDDTQVVNTAIGNVSLPMHPEMQKRMFNLDSPNSPFKDGVVKYSATRGLDETNEAFLNILRSSGVKTDGIYSQITDGGSQAMELSIVGVCGKAGSIEDPLLMIDAAYTNYNSLAARLGRKTVSVSRTLEKSGNFSLPDFSNIEKTIEKYRPKALVVIPYDNPTGQFFDMDTLAKLAKLCVKYNMWFISDEAYRELHYTDNETSTVWKIDNKLVPGIEGRRISIETSSKVWNACGLRIGALLTDNKEFNAKSIAENTANLCSNVIGQYIFGSLAHVKSSDLKSWYESQRNYYKEMLQGFTNELKERIPGIIISNPNASIYSVIDVKNVAKEGFNSESFVMYCATKGKIPLENKEYTLLTSPMEGFYSSLTKGENPGATQMRVAYVETPSKMKLAPMLFEKLFFEFEKNR